MCRSLAPVTRDIRVGRVVIPVQGFAGIYTIVNT